MVLPSALGTAERKEEGRKGGESWGQGRRGQGEGEFEGGKEKRREFRGGQKERREVDCATALTK